MSTAAAKKAKVPPTAQEASAQPPAAEAQPKLPPGLTPEGQEKPLLYKLTELEVVSYENISLKRELLRSDMERLAAQERDWTQKVSARVGEDITGWVPDFPNSQVKRPQGK